MSNQIKLTFDISDELLDKLLTVNGYHKPTERPTRGYAYAYGCDGW